MLSKARIKFVKSLQQKKHRKQEQCFTVEGSKSVLELLASDIEIVLMLTTEQFREEHSLPTDIEIIDVKESELKSLGEFQSNDSVIAVARMRPVAGVVLQHNEFALVLDDIRDPGNLGTIIRTADWYGINKIIASEETADFYNPKVISSTMGSFVRTSVYYTDLPSYLKKNQSHRIYGAFLDGDDVHTFSFGGGGYIIVGNESHGISTQLEELVTDRITIPKYGKAESLNAAIATAVICDNVRRGVDQKK